MLFNTISLMLHEVINSYKHQIGTYDKNLWEQSVEAKILKKIDDGPKKAASLKAELIDLDLIQGSTFTKAKPTHGILAVSSIGILRVIFFPFCIRWWRNATSLRIAAFCILLWSLQAVVTVFFIYQNYHEDVYSKDMSRCHIAIPIILMLIVGVSHAQIVATCSTKKLHYSKLKRGKSLKSKAREKNSSYSNGFTFKSSQTLSQKLSNGSLEYDSNKSNDNKKRQYNSYKSRSHDGVTKSSCDITVNDSKNNIQNHKKTLIENNVKCQYGDVSSVTSVKRSKSLGDDSDIISLCEFAQSVNADDKIKNPKHTCKPPDTGSNILRKRIISNMKRNGNSYSDICTDKSLNAQSIPEIRISDDDSNLFYKPVIKSDISDNNDKIYMEYHHDSDDCLDSYYAMQSKSARVSLCELSNIGEQSSISSCESDTDTVPNTPTLKERKRSSKKYFQSCPLNTELDWDDTIPSEGTSSDTDCNSDSDTNSDSKVNSPYFLSALDDPFSVRNTTKSSSPEPINMTTNSSKVSCIIFNGDEVSKIDLNVLDIGYKLIEKVDSLPASTDYVILGVIYSFILATFPVIYFLHQQQLKQNAIWKSLISYDISVIFKTSIENWKLLLIVGNGLIQRFCFSLLFFFSLSVAERTFKERLLLAKFFCHLTSSRRARKYDLPHFRLNKVRNIKTWLSLRSYLKKRGPQRSVDIIVSNAFLIGVTLVTLFSVALLHDSDSFLERLGDWELILWGFAISIYLLRFMTLGTKINKKYRNFSVLITEQINQYLTLEKNPDKREQLTLANNVLKLAGDLLRELENPFKISGLNANSFLYNLTKVFILSAFSAVLTEILGFKLKLYKIKLPK